MGVFKLRIHCAGPVLDALYLSKPERMHYLAVTQYNSKGIELVPLLGHP